MGERVGDQPGADSLSLLIRMDGDDLEHAHSGGQVAGGDDEANGDAVEFRDPGRSLRIVEPCIDLCGLSARPVRAKALEQFVAVDLPHRRHHADVRVTCQTDAFTDIGAFESSDHQHSWLESEQGTSRTVSADVALVVMLSGATWLRQR